MRKKYSPQFKAKIVQEILREEKSITQLASEYEVHVTQLRQWKRKALEGLPDLFRADDSKNENLKKLEAEQERLYAEIGRLTTQLNWLKKKGFDIESKWAAGVGGKRKQRIATIHSSQLAEFEPLKLVLQTA